MRAGWGLGVVVLVAAGGLLAGIGLGSVPGVRPVAVGALGGLPELLRPDLVVLAQPVPPATAAPPAPAPFPAAASTRPVTPPLSERPSASPKPSSATPRPASGSPTPVPASTKPSAADAGPPCAPTAHACVDLSANRSWLLEDGRVTYGPVPITHGRTGFRTPPGTFRVASKRRDHVSSIYDAEMPWSVFFHGGIAFHEGSLTALSHGCIHLAPDAARTYFDTLDVGDVVQVVR